MGVPMATTLWRPSECKFSTPEAAQMWKRLIFLKATASTQVVSPTKSPARGKSTRLRTSVVRKMDMNPHTRPLVIFVTMKTRSSLTLI